jgi:hypothetical protein
MRTITLESDAEFDAVIAALRLLARVLNDPTGDPVTVEPDDGDIGDILTNSGTHAGLTSDEVHDIADRINS